MGLLSILVSVLLPPAMLGVVLAMGRYEELILPEPEAYDPATTSRPAETAAPPASPAPPATAPASASARRRPKPRPRHARRRPAPRPRRQAPVAAGSPVTGSAIHPGR
ncbi:hypothetical protein QWM81_07560 [Streptomyces ficellus]|uniref:AI-2E family transporter n=1 Tax=Streptomyces ficellus TaxID=1977088 RepID=A0ABT7Z342_9ACTN|nr:hypothetical protein [Streptomyces ficellus]MDN3293902.1 hypothetical protein [Streptomyces ficellus]